MHTRQRLPPDENGGRWSGTPCHKLRTTARPKIQGSPKQASEASIADSPKPTRAGRQRVNATPIHKGRAAKWAR